MNTYNTYQEAKIANPDSEILTDGDKFFVHHEPYTNVFKCHPSNYCMTVEKFLADGHKFVDGDVIVNQHHEVVEFGKWYQSIRISPKEANVKVPGDDNCYILRAAALEQTETPEEKEAFDAIEQPKPKHTNVESDYDRGMRKAMQKIAVSCGRVFGSDVGYEDLPELVDSLINHEKPKHTKVEYVEVTESIFDLKDKFKRGELFKYDKGYKVITDEHVLSCALENDDCYRKVQTELTEREAFLFELNKLHDEYSAMEHDEVKGSLYDYIADSGKFKLVDGE